LSVVLHIFDDSIQFLCAKRGNRLQYCKALQSVLV
jgi:hypothetical protein